MSNKVTKICVGFGIPIILLNIIRSVFISLFPNGAVSGILRSQWYLLFIGLYALVFSIALFIINKKCTTSSKKAGIIGAVILLICSLCFLGIFSFKKFYKPTNKSSVEYQGNKYVLADEWIPTGEEVSSGTYTLFSDDRENNFIVKGAYTYRRANLKLPDIKNNPVSKIEIVSVDKSVILPKNMQEEFLNSVSKTKRNEISEKESENTAYVYIYFEDFSACCEMFTLNKTGNRIAVRRFDDSQNVAYLSDNICTYISEELSL